MNSQDELFRLVRSERRHNGPRSGALLILTLIGLLNLAVYILGEIS